MEPRVFTRGNPAFFCFIVAGSLASMEPRVFTRGNAVFFGALLLDFLASMEPRVFTRGNPLIPVINSANKNGFNGATRLHAWKPRKSYFLTT